MEQHTCKDCAFYYQHYTLDKRRIFRVHCGHCTRLRAKKRVPDAKACALFELGTSREEAFASKEYLSKELLQYVLGLELLPEIDSRG